MIFSFSAVAGAQLSRDQDPVVVSGASIPGLHGVPVDQIFVYRYDGMAGFEPVPFQVDERVLATFNPGDGDEFTEMVYDVYGLDDGLFDADDEIAFLFGGGGTQAPPGVAWPSGANTLRFCLEVLDPRTGGETRFAYVFTGVGLSTSTTSHVTWDGLAGSPIVTDDMTLGFEGRWLLTSYSVAAPCGSGNDLIDRVKGRAHVQQTFEEDEEMWNLVSTYQGGISGPIRAIRYVRGAMSAVNMIHHDIVYRKLWVRHLDVRVHAIVDARMYVDWLPAAGGVFYASTAPAGVPVDGVPDGLDGPWWSWSLTKTPGGGMVMVYDVPPDPRYQTKTALYRDDALHDDALDVGYPDEDDSAYGNHGVRISTIDDTGTDPIVIRWMAFPLCGDEGSDQLAQAYVDIVNEPLDTHVEPQYLLGPLKSLEVEVVGSDIRLRWTGQQGATSYRVMRTTDPSLPQEAWTELGDIVGTEFIDFGAAPGIANYWYSIVVVGPGGEEYW